MRASKFTAAIIWSVALGSALYPAHAELPGSTQPGATPIPVGNFLILRAVPPRNAIIPGAGDALSVRTSPPPGIFSSSTGLIRPIDDALAASITGSILPGRVGGYVGDALREALGSPQAGTASATEHASGAGGAGGQVNNAVQLGMDALRSALGRSDPGK